MITKSTHFDVIIVGAGLAGSSMAAALSSLPISIALIEAVEIPLQQSPSFDDRALALSLGSLRVLNTLGVTGSLAPSSLTPIKNIHVSDRGHAGFLRLSHTEVATESLGSVVAARDLGLALQTFLSLDDASATTADITSFSPAVVSTIVHRSSGAHIDIDHQGQSCQLSASLVILADGGRSPLTKVMGIDSDTKHYQQTGVLANIRADKPHRNQAYERFTCDGPIALLPLRDQDYKLVWTVPSHRSEAMMALHDTDFLSQIQEAFGDRAGKFIQVGKRQNYPMTESSKKQMSAGRVVLIGNAAHTLHPIAGQGFNLGLRDVACLAELIAEAISLGKDIGAPGLLANYQALRQRDINNTAQFTDGLVRLFSNNNLPLAALRNIGLLALDRLPFAKRDVMRKMMGLSGWQSKLMRGIALQSEVIDD
ncbi:MAG: 2-octaprenyl-6-methoxyphenyl hydroxylase [Arenicella sp.]